MNERETRSQKVARWATMTAAELQAEWSADHARLVAKYEALTDEQKARIPVVG